MTIEELETIAKGYYGDACVWSQDSHIYIHFPEIIISNTLGESHTIRDLIVQIAFTTELTCVNDIKGVRVTRTYQEQCTHYNHSHLTGDPDMENFHTYCLGRSPLATIVNVIASDGITTDNFEMLCTILDRYVRHESIEGGPYKRISSIKGVAESAHTPDLRQNELLNAMNFIFRRSVLPRAHICISGMHTRITITDDDMDEYLKEVLGNRPFYMYMIKMGTPVDTIYYKPNNKYSGTNSNETTTIGGREFKLTIIKDEPTKRERTQRLIHPKFREYVKDRFYEYALQKRAPAYNIARTQTFYRIF